MMPRGRSFDVIVLGGGFAGRSVALHGARHGMKVLVLEPPGETRPGVWLPPASEPADRRASVFWPSVPGTINYQAPAEVEQFRVAEKDELRQAVDFGASAREVGSEELSAMMPALAVDRAGAVLSRRLDFAETGRLFIDLRREAETAGATVAENLPPLGIERDGAAWRIRTEIGAYRAARLVNAAGMRAAAVAAELGEPLPSRSCSSLYLATAPASRLIPGIVSLPESHLSLRQSASGSVVVRRDRIPGAGGDPIRPFPLELAAAARIACRFFPALADLAVARTWSTRQLRLPDDRPVVGPGAQGENLFHLFGIDDPAAEIGAGAVLAGWLATGTCAIGVDEMRIERFAGHT